MTLCDFQPPKGASCGQWLGKCFIPLRAQVLSYTIKNFTFPLFLLFLLCLFLLMRRAYSTHPYLTPYPFRDASRTSTLLSVLRRSILHFASLSVLRSVLSNVEGSKAKDANPECSYSTKHNFGMPKRHFEETLHSASEKYPLEKNFHQRGTLLRTTKEPSLDWRKNRPPI